MSHDIEQTPEEIHADIDKAAKEFNLTELKRLMRLPEDVIVGQRVMGRKERRQWYRDNKSRLKLPPWGQLDTLTKK